ncbi:MAG: hypothetical protein LBQ12_14985 [Deltaproteobacteria bacterium]|nr:hypothetical protein [Deltaproteobacteria bacterium]
MRGDESPRRPRGRLPGQAGLRPSRGRRAVHTLRQDIRTFAKFRRERRDGSGYPNGLSGNCYPLRGRLMAACDEPVSKRPSKAPSRTTRPGRS